MLERLSGELCDAVTGRTGGQEMLERVERANLFLVPLDAARRWWRYHHLFADLLRIRLRQEQPDRVTLLHHRAAAWSEAHGLADDAVRHALAAGDHAWAGRLVERHLDGLLLRSERVTLAGWLAALPAELVATRPRLLLGQTLFSLVSGEVDDALGPLDAAERAAANAARRAVRAIGRPGRQPGRQRPRDDRARPGLPGRAARRPGRRDHLRPPGPDRHRRGRADPARHHPRAPGRCRVAAWSPARGRADPGAEQPRTDRGRPALPGRADLRAPRPGAVGPRRSRRGGGRLPAGDGHRRPARRDGAARRRHRGRRPGRGGLPAQPAGCGPGARHPGHRTVPAARLLAAAGHRVGHAGPDPPGHRGLRRCRGRHRGGPALCAQPERGQPAQPGPRAAGAASSWPRAMSPRTAGWARHRGLHPDDEPSYPQ